jgi:uncharacterized membrane protein YbhN (UPF0104 family)
LNKFKTTLTAIVSLVVILAIGFFFYREFHANWNAIQLHNLRISIVFMLLSLCAVFITYLLTTFGWFLTINSISVENTLTFTKSIAVVNSSNLTKYIPGKVWSYALQMYWLSKAGYSKSLILYVNLINLFVQLIASLILGLSYLVFSSSALSLRLVVVSFTLLLLFDIAFIKYNSMIFNACITVINKIFKRDIKYFYTSEKILLQLHAINFIASFFFGMGAYLACLGVGFEVSPMNALTIMSAMMISDVMGFMAVIVPGGLGVREGVMYLLLKGVSSGPLSLILPIATRIVNMLVDISLGTIGFILLKKLSRSKNS